MNKATQIILSVSAVLLVGIFGYQFVAPTLGGDFAGGVVPTNLWTASVSTGGVTPVGNLSVGFGGTAAANQIVTLYTAIVTYPWTPSSTSAITILSSSTPFGSATTTQVAFNSAGFSVGDPCEVEYTFTTSSLIMSANVTAVSGNAVTTTVNILNASGASVTATVTSTVTGVSSTLKTTCFHTGV